MGLKRCTICHNHVWWCHISSDRFGRQALLPQHGSRRERAGAGVCETSNILAISCWSTHLCHPVHALCCRDAVLDVETAPPGKFKDGMGAIYGMAESIPDRSLVDELAKVRIFILSD